MGCRTGPRSRWSSNCLEGAQKSWRRLDGHNQLPKLVLGVTFNDGIEVIAKPTDRQTITAAA
jgi:putative transposase